MSTSQSLPAWKEEVNAKLNEHRSRRKTPAARQSGLAELDPSFTAPARQPVASRIAARVAERYAKAPSYREMIEQEAANAPARLVQHEPEPDPASEPEPTLFEAAPAHTAPTPMPEAAAPQTQQVQASELQAPGLQITESPATESQPSPSQPSQSQPSAEPRARLNRWADFDPSPIPEFFSGPATPAAEPAAPAANPQPEPEIAPEIAPAPIQSQLIAEAPDPGPSLFFQPEPVTPQESPSEQPALPNFAPVPREEPETLSLLDELATQPLEPAQPLPARIIEFPRELVAPRKARPRRERTPGSVEDHHSQLRIFEVEPETGAALAEPETEIAPPAEPRNAPSPTPEHWNAIRLDEDPEAYKAAFFEEVGLAEPSTSLLLDPPIYTANLEDRLMAGLVDLCLVGVGFLTSVAVFALSASHLPTGKFALAAAAGALLAFFLVYQFLFLAYAGGTPGMRYAKIALCTFDDENPTRESLRARVPAILLSALPLGLGFLWSFFDEDRLGWHDRITRTYQRSYREN